MRAPVFEYDEMLEGVRESEAATHGRLRLGFHGPVGWANVAMSTAEFRESHPDVEVSLVIGTWTSLLGMLRDGSLDLAIAERAVVKMAWSAGDGWFSATERLAVGCYDA